MGKRDRERIVSTCEPYASLRFSDVFEAAVTSNSGRKKTNVEFRVTSVTEVLHPKSSADHKLSCLPLQKRLEILYSSEKKNMSRKEISK